MLVEEVWSRKSPILFIEHKGISGTALVSSLLATRAPDLMNLCEKLGGRERTRDSSILRFQRITLRRPNVADRHITASTRSLSKNTRAMSCALEAGCTQAVGPSGFPEILVLANLRSESFSTRAQVRKPNLRSERRLNVVKVLRERTPSRSLVLGPRSRKLGSRDHYSAKLSIGCPDSCRECYAGDGIPVSQMSLGQCKN